MSLVHVVECYLQSVLVILRNQTLSLESQLKVLQEKWTSDGLPPAVHAAITNAVDAEVRQYMNYTSMLMLRLVVQPRLPLCCEP